MSHIIQHSSNLFTYSAKTHTFIAEVSELSYNKPSWCSSIGESDKMGFQMLSSKTKNVIEFYINECHKNDDNEITHWILIPTPTSLDKFPHMKGVMITIFND